MSPETLLSIRAIVPSYAIAFLGFLLGRWDKSLHRKTISDLIYYVFSPCLIFSALYKRTFNPREFLTLGLSAMVLILAMFPLAWAYKRLARIEGRGIYLPIVFMSTGTVSMPICLLLYGNEGLAKAVMFHIVNVLLLYTLGAYLVSGVRSGLARRALKIPALYAAGLGILVAVTPTLVRGPVQEAFWLMERGIDIVALGAVPLMTVSFGYALTDTRITQVVEGVLGACLRILGGPLLGFALVLAARRWGLFPMDKGYDLLGYIDLRTTEAVILLNAAMPGPIMAYMLSVKYDASPERAATNLALGTLGGLVTIPVVLKLINHFIF